MPSVKVKEGRMEEGMNCKQKPDMTLPVCSVAMTVDYNKNIELHDIMLGNTAK